MSCSGSSVGVDRPSRLKIWGTSANCTALGPAKKSDPASPSNVPCLVQAHLHGNDDEGKEILSPVDFFLFFPFFLSCPPAHSDSPLFARVKVVELNLNRNRDVTARVYYFTLVGTLPPVLNHDVNAIANFS